MDQSQCGRPGSVGTAVKLLYVTLGIAVVMIIMDTPMSTQGTSPGSVKLVSIISLGIPWFFIHMIGKGRNWARITSLVLFITGVPFVVLPLLQRLTASPIYGLLGIGQVVIELIALVLLFQKPSSAWFKGVKV